MDAMVESCSTVLKPGRSTHPLFVDEVWDIDEESEENQNEDDTSSTFRITNTTGKIGPFLRIRMANEQKAIDRQSDDRPTGK